MKDLGFVIGERDEGQWWIYTVDPDSKAEVMQGPYPSRAAALAQGDDMLLCDQCWSVLVAGQTPEEAAMFPLAECQDRCSLNLDHDGECGERYGKRSPQTRCSRCLRTDRLTRVPLADLA